MFYYVAYMRDGSALTGFNHRRDTYGEALADGWSRVAGREGEVREMVVLRKREE